MGVPSEPNESILPKKLLELAPRLVREAIRIKEGQVVEVTLTGERRYLDILDEFTLEISRLGAHPTIRLNSPTYRRRFMETVPEDYLRKPPPQMVKWIDDIDRHINLLADTPDFNPMHISQKKMRYHREAQKKITGKIQQRNVTTICIPTVELANFCGFALETIEYRLISSLNVDYSELRRDCRHLAEEIRRKKQTITLCSGNGAELTCCLGDRQVWIEDGRHELPAGLVFFAPQENTVNGSVFIDKLNVSGRLVQNMMLIFENGRLKHSEAEDNHRVFIDLVKKSYGDSEVFAGIGMGLNPGIDGYIGCDLLDFIAKGVVHIGMGSNLLYGGSNFSDLFLRIPVADPRLRINGDFVIS
ncbi:aminopeptidase [bacterium]|nr:aminopeptidase [candidate division CSSED10-310 bacterium]